MKEANRGKWSCFHNLVQMAESRELAKTVEALTKKQEELEVRRREANEPKFSINSDQSILLSCESSLVTGRNLRGRNEQRRELGLRGELL